MVTSFTHVPLVDSMNSLHAIHHSTLILSLKLLIPNITVVIQRGWMALLAQRCDFHMFLFIYKALTGKLPNCLSSLTVESTNTYISCSSEWLQLKKSPKSLLTWGDLPSFLAS